MFGGAPYRLALLVHHAQLVHQLVRIADFANRKSLCSLEHVGRVLLVFALHGGCIDGNNRLPLQPRRKTHNNQPLFMVGEVLLRTWMCSAPAEEGYSERKGAAN